MGEQALIYVCARRIVGGIGPALPARRSGASVSSPIFDCTSCGACCFGGHDRYVALLPEDHARAIPDNATTHIEGRRYMSMVCGHCAQLTVSPEGRTLCAIYDARPEACRAFRAGSFECLKARQHRGAAAEALRAFAMEQSQEKPPLVGADPVVAAAALPTPPQGAGEGYGEGVAINPSP